MELVPQAPGRGRCEVVCFSPHPTDSFCQLSQRRIRTIIEAWADRTEALSALTGIEQVFCFENRGPEIGVTLQHPHGQIYAYPFLPPRTQAILRQARQYYEDTRRQLQHDVVMAELAAKTRVVCEGEYWFAYVPAAAKWPLEVMLVPRRDVPDFPSLSESERAELAVMYPLSLIHI